jgi:hypothetical protein
VLRYCIEVAYIGYYSVPCTLFSIITRVSYGKEYNLVMVRRILSYRVIEPLVCVEGMELMREYEDMRDMLALGLIAVGDMRLSC